MFFFSMEIGPKVPKIIFGILYIFTLFSLDELLMSLRTIILYIYIICFCSRCAILTHHNIDVIDFCTKLYCSSIHNSC